MSLIPDEHRILVNDENASQTNKVAVKSQTKVVAFLYMKGGDDM